MERWFGPFAVTVLGGALRFWNLEAPYTLMFDETYYVKDAYSLMRRGYESKWAEDMDHLFAAGDFSAMLTDPSYAVHPPVGKWLIGLGMWLFGPDSSFGWRFSTALFGTAAVFLVILVGWRLFNSQALGLIAGLLLAVDGIGIVLSRTGLLDVFLMFFALLGFWFTLKDRAVMDERLALALRTPVGHGANGAPRYPGRVYGPRLGMRWHLVGAGVALGLATGVKWSGLFFLAAFGALVVAWDAAARRRAGVRRWVAAGCLLDGVKAFLLMVPVAFVVYVGSWTGWLMTKGGYFRDWADKNPGEGVLWLPAPLRSLLHYHLEAYKFHTTLTSEHTYMSNPALWLIQQRPTCVYYTTHPTCSSAECSQEILALGNPLIWWFGVIALGVVIYNAVVWADRRCWAILMGYVGGYLPWLFYAHRTIFNFYTVAFLPYVVLALAYAAGRLIGPPVGSDGAAGLGIARAPARAVSGRAVGEFGDLRPAARGARWPADLGAAALSPFARPADPQPRRRRRAIIAVTVLLSLILFMSAFFWPIWSAGSVPKIFWQLHMWMPSWI